MPCQFSTARCIHCDAPFEAPLDYRRRVRRTVCAACNRLGQSLATRLWAKVTRSGHCWLWTGGHNGRGYGTLKVDGRMQYAHRLVWSLLHGPILTGFYVCHCCDQPSCVRPSHLFLGTQSDNMRDCVAKGRRPSKYQWHPHQ